MVILKKKNQILQFINFTPNFIVKSQTFRTFFKINILCGILVQQDDMPYAEKFLIVYNNEARIIKFYWQTIIL
jgi:hypothetical protein